MQQPHGVYCIVPRATRTNQATSSDWKLRPGRDLGGVLAPHARPANRAAVSHYKEVTSRRVQDFYPGSGAISTEYGV